MTEYVYDVEIFPNLFTATFLDIHFEDIYQFTIHKGGIDQRNEILEFLKKCKLLIGFNSLSYDDPILKTIISNIKSRNLNNDLYEMSKRLIDDYSRDDPEIRKLRYTNDNLWKPLDLMKIMAFDSLGVNLKQTGINLRWHRIQDLPLPFDHIVKTDEIKTILDYNLNDVYITYELYKAIQPQINLRKDIGAIYDVDVSSASDSKMANILLEKIYTEELKVDIKTLRPLRTKYSSVQLKDCISPNIKFKSKILTKLYEDMKAITVYKESNYSYKNTVNFNGIFYELGVGGLHSKDQPAKYYSTNEMTIRDADVGSYYPNILINGNYKPAHLGIDFIKILKKITDDRMDAKHKGDIVKANALKITVNSIFGKLGSDTFWLEDAQAFLSVTVSGQLFLLMLIEDLALHGIQNISANTDGVICQVPKDKEELYYSICKNWEKNTNFELEFTDYEVYIRSDVNNYITKKKDGKTKEKGRFFREVDLKKGYKYPIIPECLYQYFIHNKPVSQTLQECKNILDFCISQKAGGQFKMEYHDVNTTITLQKNNRFYISNRGGSLIKRNSATNKSIGLYVGNVVKILNDYDKTATFESYGVNLRFYEKEVYKIIDAIEPQVIQNSLFSFAENIKEVTPNNSQPQDLIETYLDEEVCPTCDSDNVLITELRGYCVDCESSWILN